MENSISQTLENFSLSVRIPISYYISVDVDETSALIFI